MPGIRAMQRPQRALLLKRIRRQRFLLAALGVYVVFILIFSYYPMYGMLLAFKDFSIRRGIMGSPWVGWKWLSYFFKSPDFRMIMRNTLGMSILRLIFGFPAPILFALCLNELRHSGFKRIVQSISYLPHFISWIVITGLVQTLLAGNGLVNNVMLSMGLIRNPIFFLGRADFFWGIITILGIWKEVGWGSIIYLSAMTSIDPELYESAVIDGAGRLRQALSITIPCILPTVVMLLIMQLGYMLSVGFEQQFFLQNPMNYKAAEVIDTYVFKVGLQGFQFSYSTAVDLVKSVIGLTLVLCANQLTRKFIHMSIF